jgi:prepilin-type N-terminal cleavage/methylation domain-containing protein
MGIRGFTFVEIILVIVIMAIAIPALVSAVSLISQDQVNPMGATVATTLAQEGMEAVIAMKQSNCATCGYASIAVNTPPGTAFTAIPGFPDYQIQTNVALVDANINPSGVDLGYKQVTVTVHPVGVGPSVPDAVLTTVLTNY